MGFLFKSSEWQAEDGDDAGPISRSFTNKAKEERSDYDDWDGGPIGYIFARKAREAAAEREAGERALHREPLPPKAEGPSMSEETAVAYTRSWPEWLSRGGRTRESLPEEDLDSVIDEYFDGLLFRLDGE
jgi:hypothetical protein